MKTRFGFSQDTLERILSCTKAFPNIQKLTIYGSRARGDFREGSDIDLCIFGEALSDTEVAKFCDAIDDLDLIYTFDIVHFDALHNEDFKNKILSESVELHHIAD